MYCNPFNKVVIRQQGDGGYNEDSWIVINPEHVHTLCNALMEWVALIEANPVQPQEQPEPAKVKDKTAAERQRRHRAKRDRHRDIDRYTMNGPDLPLLQAAE